LIAVNQRIRRKLKAAVIFLVLGAFVGTICDSFHVSSGVIVYPVFEWYPFMFQSGQPFWVPILMSGATVVMAWGHLWSDRWLRDGYGKRLPGYVSLPRWGLGFLVSISIWAISGYLPWDRVASDGGLALAALGIWAFNDRTAPGLVQAGLTAVGGVLVEYLLSSNGAFHYAPGIQGPWGVPSWLPWIYVGFSPVCAGLARRLVRGRS
jgi:hypothetical protein